DGLIKRVLRQYRTAAKTIWVERIVGERADGERRSELERAKKRRVEFPQRQSGHASRERFVAALDLFRPRVVAVVLEAANPVVQGALEKSPVNLHAGVTRRRQRVGAER